MRLKKAWSLTLLQCYKSTRENCYSGQPVIKSQFLSIFLLVPLQTLLDQQHVYYLNKSQFLSISLLVPLQTLPDQQHVYYLNQSRDGILSGEGCLVRKIPFTHPTMVPSVLNLLRQQLVFNSVLSSIIRPLSRKGWHSQSIICDIIF
ncbi:hypothetical protein DPMN_060904 [Dreissena polymorpha]|uniref:Mediator of RNA polymerase II transcription subunit 1 n=1 Tax=Dreissena polymorpha TaxID=45954 RepID=A0A9D4C6G5_DREPO|nr:hypothetical protein DPMN_060904 [Dreissena polymorpha]